MERINNKIIILNTLRRLVILIFGILICSLGMALLIKANLGQSTLTAFSYNLGLAMKIKVGTIVGFLNYLCFFGQIVLLKKKFKKIQILQLPMTFLFSNLINLYIYTMPYISTMIIKNYGLKLIVLGTGTVFIAYGVILMVIADLIILPFEAFAKELSIKCNIKFGTLRRYMDISLVLLSLLVIIIYKLPNTSIREGTIIYTYFSGLLMNYFLRKRNRLKN